MLLLDCLLRENDILLEFAVWITCQNTFKPYTQRIFKVEEDKFIQKNVNKGIYDNSHDYLVASFTHQI